ncbi:MAG: serine hydrolase [Deltaproteobacteria bacterium]|nr:serine hydrolase [Deltaproteobacteria bacterium]MBW2117704.1 serine hydrolase [Deltaproteobacteria bacterium]MBW2344133.1 serine hydrolase [Deltaproteobacteria bacterium]
MDEERKDWIQGLLTDGVREGVYPGAVLLVAQGGGIAIFEEVGNRSLSPQAASMTRGTIFDLASLTKPLSTTLAIMKLIDEGEIDLDQTLESLLSRDMPKDKRILTPRLLLNHCAGFVDWKPFYLELERLEVENRKESLRELLLNMPLVYRPGDETLYSDLGFMILEWVIEERAGMSLPEYLEKYFYAPLLLKNTFFSTSVPHAGFMEDQFAATEDCPWRKKIVSGYVHDENAYALGGYSGHAGLFGTAEDVYALVNLLRGHYHGERGDYLKRETVREFFTRQDLVKGSTWALGWDTPSPEGSSSGKYFSANSVGHLGFTGTSVWMDLDRDIIVIFLTNRVHPTRNNEKIKAFRPRIHDLVMEELGKAIQK